MPKNVRKMTKVHILFVASCLMTSCSLWTLTDFLPALDWQGEFVDLTTYIDASYPLGEYRSVTTDYSENEETFEVTADLSYWDHQENKGNLQLSQDVAYMYDGFCSEDSLYILCFLSSWEGLFFAKIDSLTLSEVFSLTIPVDTEPLDAKCFALGTDAVVIWGNLTAQTWAKIDQDGTLTDTHETTFGLTDYDLLTDTTTFSGNSKLTLGTTTYLSFQGNLLSYADSTPAFTPTIDYVLGFPKTTDALAYYAYESTSYYVRPRTDFSLFLIHGSEKTVLVNIKGKYLNRLTLGTSFIFEGDTVFAVSRRNYYLGFSPAMLVYDGVAKQAYWNEFGDETEDLYGEFLLVGNHLYNSQRGYAEEPPFHFWKSPIPEELR